MTTQDKERTFTVRLGSRLDSEVDRLARDMDISRSEIVRKAVRMFVARQKHMDELLSEARERHAAYKMTGRGVPWTEVAEWLNNGARQEDRPVVRDMRR